MFKCDLCEKEFTSVRGLNGHKRLHGESNGSYSVSRRKSPLTYICQFCGKTKTYSPKATDGKFCSNICQGKYSWEYITKPKLLAGNGNKGPLKKYLIETFGYKCSTCGISDWNGNPLSLHLDHIDGNSDNNTIENGRLLCPNCHSQTDTFCSRNKKNTERNRYQQRYKAEMKQK